VRIVHDFMNKGSSVRDMFGRIAGRYDAANSVMTGGMDARWRARAVGLLAVGRQANILDACCGTGALARAAARAVPDGGVVGIDFSEPMLRAARARRGPPNVSYVEGDVLALPFRNAEFDGATMGFSMRNVVDIEACLRELARVLKPGARFVNLEVSRPTNPLWRRMFSAYFFGMVPIIGGIVGGDLAAYRYLPQSLVNFPDPPELARLFASNGFTNVRYIGLMGGISTLHVGERAPVVVAPAKPVPEPLTPAPPQTHIEV